MPKPSRLHRPELAASLALGDAAFDALVADPPRVVRAGTAMPVVPTRWFPWMVDAGRAGMPPPGSVTEPRRGPRMAAGRAAATKRPPRGGLSRESPAGRQAYWPRMRPWKRVPPLPMCGSLILPIALMRSSARRSAAL